jgi:hypothetical protein
MQSYMFLLLLEVSPANQPYLKGTGNLTFNAVHTCTAASIDAHGRTIGRPLRIAHSMT